MSGHKAVLACLPSGVYGTTSATSLVTEMRQTFRSIKFGLMVGVGGGLPTNGVDIRLGDIFVSISTGVFSSVVQVDYEKAIKVQSNDRVKGTNIGRIVHEVIHQHQAVEAFARPDGDWLFHLMYDHPIDDTDCRM